MVTKAQLGERRPEFWQDDPDYHGVLFRDGALRLAVSPNGKRYLLQERGADGRFVVVRWRKSLSALVAFLPEGIKWDALVSLPDDPRAFVRPWADAMAAQSERLKAFASANRRSAMIKSAQYRLSAAQRALEALEADPVGESREKPLGPCTGRTAAVRGCLGVSPPGRVRVTRARGR